MSSSAETEASRDLVGPAEFLLARDHRQWRDSAGSRAHGLLRLKQWKTQGR